MSDAKRITLGAPMPLGTGAASFGNGTHTLTGSTFAFGAAMQMPVADTISHIGFHYFARAGTPPVQRVSLQSANTSTGAPDGTVLGGGSPASGLFTPPANATWDSTWQWVALDNPYTCTRGQLLVPVIDYSSGTIDGSNNSRYIHNVISVGWQENNFPYSLQESSGTWTKVARMPVLGLRSSTARYGYMCGYEGTYTTATAGTNGHRKAMKFNLPSGWGTSFKVVGVRFHGGFSGGTGQTFKVALWDATTELQAVTFDSDVLSQAPTTQRLGEFMFDESTLSTLSYGTDYYIGLEVTSSSAVSVYGVNLDASDDLSAYPGGSSFYLSSYAGSWSDTQSVRPLCELMLEDITVPAGGSAGMLFSPNLQGV